MAAKPWHYKFLGIQQENVKMYRQEANHLLFWKDIVESTYTIHLTADWSRACSRMYLCGVNTYIREQARDQSAVKMMVWQGELATICRVVTKCVS
jgi:hypothetical protein